MLKYSDSDQIQSPLSEYVFQTPIPTKYVVTPEYHLYSYSIIVVIESD